MQRSLQVLRLQFKTVIPALLGAIENVEVVRKATVLFSDEAFHVGVVLELTARKGRVTGSDDSNKSVPIHHTPDALCRYWSWNWCWQKCWHARWHT